MYCIICSGNKIKKHNIVCPTFEHAFYNNLSKKLIRYECLDCNIIFNRNLKSNFKIIFKKNNYKKHSENHTYNINQVSIPKEKLQSHIITKEIIKFKREVNILDYGCFDGALLEELSKLDIINSLVGYDIIKPTSRKKNNKIKYFVDDYKNLSKQYKKAFDIIIFSHSLNYIPRVKYKINQIFQNLLKDDGLIFIQIPDITKKYLNILFDDQLYFFHKYSIIKLFNSISSKFKINFLSNKFISNDLLVLIRKNYKNNNFKINKISIIKFFKKIKIDIKRYQNLVVDQKSFFIFGSTIDAIFASYFFKNKKISFIDENKKKINTTINGIRINSLNTKLHNKKILIPFSMKANNFLKKRLIKNKFLII